MPHDDSSGDGMMLWFYFGVILLIALGFSR